jgi:hypothetical protein
VHGSPAAASKCTKGAWPELALVDVIQHMIRGHSGMLPEPLQSQFLSRGRKQLLNITHVLLIRSALNIFIRMS